MSASLVGSEMCIRDRGSRSRAWMRADSRRLLLSGLFFVTCAHKGQGAAPVSYTHLTLPTICSV
eukprot:1533656-Alexandrium_andersonii.AAC.1